MPDEFGGIEIGDEFGGIALDETPSTFKDLSTGPLTLTNPLQPPSLEQLTTYGGGRKPLASYAETMESIRSGTETPAMQLAAPRPVLTEPRLDVPDIPINEKEAGFTEALTKESLNALIGVPKFFTSDAGILSLLSAKLSPRLTSAGFSSDLLSSAWNQAKQIYADWDTMTPAQKGVATARLLSTTVFGGLAGTHAAGKIRIPGFDEAKPSADIEAATAHAKETPITEPAPQIDLTSATAQEPAISIERPTAPVIERPTAPIFESPTVPEVERPVQPERPPVTPSGKGRGPYRMIDGKLRDADGNVVDAEGNIIEARPEPTPEPAEKPSLPLPVPAAKEEPKPAEPTPVEAAAPVAAEKIVSTAWKMDDGSIITGKTPNRIHSLILDDFEKTSKEGENRAAVESGFVTSTGRFVNADEAAVISGTGLKKLGAEHLTKTGNISLKNVELQKQFDAEDAAKSAPPPPSPEAQAKPAAAPTEAKTEVGERKATELSEIIPENIKSDPRLDEPGITRIAKPNSLIIQLRDLESVPVREVIIESKGDPLADSKAFKEVLKREVNSPSISQRESMAVSTGPNGRAIYHFSESPSGTVWTSAKDLIEARKQIQQPPPQPSAGIEKQGGEGKLTRESFDATPWLSSGAHTKPAAQSLAIIEALDGFKYVQGRTKKSHTGLYPFNLETKSGKIIASIKGLHEYADELIAKENSKPKPEPPTPGPAAQTVGKLKGPGIQGMGGATPAEFAKGQGSPTAMKYRLIDQERQKRGLEPLSKPDRISDQKTMDKAIAAMDQNPNLPDQLILELRAKPRAIEDWENHVLLLRKIELREEYHKAAREAMQAYADSTQFPERLADMEAANARTQFYSEKLTELEEASRVAGSARGRALRALRVMANEDFSLASLEMEKRAANNWRPLTPDERAELIKIADEHKAKSEELQKRLDELEKSQQDKEVGTVLTNLKAEVKRNPVAPTSIDLLSGKIRGKLEKDPKADIRFYVRKIARYFVSQGTKERDVLVDQVHGVLSGIIPDLDRRTTMDLISGYGDYSRLPKDTVSVILRDLSGQMQQIAKLEDMMRGEAPLRSGQERRTPSDVERILQKQVEEQKKKGGYAVTDPETQLRTAQEAVQKRLQNQITDLELQIQTRQKIIKNPTKLQYDAKSNQLKARRDELKAVYDEIFAKPAKTEAERLAEWKERTKDRIDELKEFLAGTKQPKQKPIPVVLDKEALRIRFDLHTIERLWREKIAKEKRDQWTRWQKAKTIPAEVLNVSRALLTSFDFSAPGRQGIIIGLAHPLRAASALKPMFEAWRSEKGAFDAAEQIRNRNNAPLYEIGKLYLAEHGGRLSRQEEAYMSRWAAKIPGIRASERAYVTFLNRLRADSFDSMVEGLTANGTANPAELKAIANFINVATGRGVGLEKSGTTLNTVFFAPRYVFSRFQFLAGQPLYKGTAATRKAIAKEYGKFLAGAAVVYALASSAGADVGTDPRSSDFGKIIIGNTRIDPMAGLNQVSTLVGRTITGETKPIKGRAYPIVGKVPYGKSNLLDVMMNFGRGKLSPAIGTGISLRLGKDVANQPFGVSDLPKSMGVPISWQDMYSAMREEGVPAGIAMGMLSMFGIGVNTYEQQNRR